MKAKPRAAAATPGSRRGATTRALPPAHGRFQPATVDRILGGARDVLVKHGYAGFTIRRVAEAASIMPGNISYHFANKRELLRALISRLVADYSSQFETFLSDPGIPLGQEVASLVHWLLTDAVAEETVHTFRELWTIALRDAVVRRAVDDFYDDVMNGVAQLLLRSRPKADAGAVREFVQVLASMSEGTNVLYGTRMSRAVPHERFIEIATELLRTLAPELQLDTSPSGEGPQPARAKAARNRPI
jgi:AcrR family transcriptional regulator